MRDPCGLFRVEIPVSRTMIGGFTFGNPKVGAFAKRPVVSGSFVTKSVFYLDPRCLIG